MVFGGVARWHVHRLRQNAGSVLRVMMLNAVGGNTTKVLWPAAPGRVYRLQVKNQHHRHLAGLASSPHHQFGHRVGYD